MTTTVRNRDEAKLIRAAQGGSREAMDELFQAYYRQILLHAKRLLRNDEDAADAAQMTFVKAQRSIREFDAAREFAPWLYRICSNVCIDVARRRKRTGEDLESHAYYLESDSDPEGDAIRSQLGRRVREAVRRLPKQYREVIVLRHFAGMDVSEVAHALGAPVGTVKSWLFRARAMLRRELEASPSSPIPAA